MRLVTLNVRVNIFLEIVTLPVLYKTQLKCLILVVANTCAIRLGM